MKKSIYRYAGEGIFYKLNPDGSYFEIEFSVHGYVALSCTQRPRVNTGDPKFHTVILKREFDELFARAKELIKNTNKDMSGLNTNLMKWLGEKINY